MKKVGFLGFLIAAVFCLIMLVTPAFAQGVSYYGWSGQEETIIVGVPANTWQVQEMYQQVMLGVGNQQIAEVDTYGNGYMEQNVQDEYSGVYTGTSNDAGYTFYVDSTGIYAGTNADASATSVSVGNASGNAGAGTSISIISP